jgi:hypothetical protein
MHLYDLRSQKVVFPRPLKAGNEKNLADVINVFRRLEAEGFGNIIMYICIALT